MNPLVLAHPIWLWGIPLIPLFLYFRLQVLEKKRRTIFLSFSSKIPLKTFNRGKIWFWGEQILLFLVLCLFFLLLSRPQKISFLDQDDKREGIDIVIALDISESMLAEDLPPSRLEAAKKYLADFIKGLETDQVGVVVFAGKAFMQAPLTFDYEVVLEYLKEVSVRTIEQRRVNLGGTALGDSLLEAEKRLKNDPERTKVVILITDGKANVGADPMKAAQFLAKKKVKLYTIGVGTLAGGKIPLGIRNGQTIYGVDQDGNIVIAPFEEGVLREMARSAGGQYFYAPDNEALNESLQAISALEKKPFKKEEQTLEYQDDFAYFLLGLMGALVVFFFYEAVSPLRA